jgi:acetoin utilization deacetylase AcuC-like enzyme
LLLTGVGDALDRREAPLASVADIELAHDRLHVAALRGLEAELADQIQAGGPPYCHLDADTAMNPHTWTAALRAAGAALAATDAVMAGELENAFCAVRPPGHHAGRSQAMGFCFLNNVAIAARHALERHGLQRVAIVDFDVHHGNGTEDILAGDERVLMVGIFQQGLYPFSGDTPRGPNMANIPVPAYTRGMEVRELIEQEWVPRLDAFKPQMIFISAGFDAHRDDELGQLGLVEQDYTWITSRMREIARRHAKGRIVSCLEGGYDLGALARSVEAHLRALADL